MTDNAGSNAALEALEQAIQGARTAVDGVFSEQELATLFSAMGSPLGPQELGAVMKELDLDEDGSVSMEEILDYMMRERAATLSKADLRDEFDKVDIDGDGFISVSELQIMMCEMGESVTAAEAEGIVARLDTDGDGRISYAEYVALMRG